MFAVFSTELVVQHGGVIRQFYLCLKGSRSPSSGSEVKWMAPLF